MESEAGDWLAEVGGRGPVELITTTGLAAETGSQCSHIGPDHGGGVGTQRRFNGAVRSPVVGQVEEAVSSCRMELMKVVGEMGVSTGEAPPSRTGHTSTSGLDGSSFTLTAWLTLQVTQEVESVSAEGPIREKNMG